MRRWPQSALTGRAPVHRGAVTHACRWHSESNQGQNLFVDYATVADSIGVYTTMDYASIVDHLVRCRAGRPWRWGGGGGNATCSSVPEPQHALQPQYAKATGQGPFVSVLSKLRSALVMAAWGDRRLQARASADPVKHETSAAQLPVRS